MENEMTFNLKVANAKNMIMKAIVDCQLPATVTQLILLEIKSIVDKETDQIVKRENDEYTVVTELSKAE